MAADEAQAFMAYLVEQGDVARVQMFGELSIEVELVSGFRVRAWPSVTVVGGDGVSLVFAAGNFLARPVFQIEVSAPAFEAFGITNPEIIAAGVQYVINGVCFAWFQ